MDKESIISKTEEFVKSWAINNEPGHDYSHILRVRDLALKIAKEAGYAGYLVELIALLHDLEDHKLSSKTSIKDFLDTLEISKEDKEKILYIIPRISFSKYPLVDDLPLEGKIVADADRLDAIGAIGVARAFSYGGANKRHMYEGNNSTIKHFEEKLLILDQYLYLDASKKLAKQRMKFI